MKLTKNTNHSISSFSSLLLFGIFALFLMLMLLFSARLYQQTVSKPILIPDWELLLPIFLSSSASTTRQTAFSPVPWMVLRHFVSVTK